MSWFFYGKPGASNLKQPTQTFLWSKLSYRWRPTLRYVSPISSRPETGRYGVQTNALLRGTPVRVFVHGLLCPAERTMASRNSHGVLSSTSMPFRRRSLDPSVEGFRFFRFRSDYGQSICRALTRLGRGIEANGAPRAIEFLKTINAK